MRYLGGFEGLLKDYKDGYLTDRQLLTYVKNSEEYKEEIVKRTTFLNDYDMYDIVERLYYVVNNLTEVVKCKYCGNKATWCKRGLKEGYRSICSSKECKSKNLADAHEGNTLISENRDKEFIEWQKSVTMIDDNIVKEHIKYDKFIPMITNPIILNYLNNRFKDSDSIEETLKRIEIGVEEKPKCALPGCNNPVTFIGRKRAMFSKFCCPAHSAQSEETRAKCKQTNLEHWGTENVYDSEKYRQKMMDEYGVEYSWQREDVKKKRSDACLEKYGIENPAASPEVRLKSYESLVRNGKCQKSDKEDEVADYIESLGYKVERHKRTEKFPYNVDIYLPEFDLFIEYQGSQFHNNYSFMGTEEDKKLLEEYKKRSDELKKSEDRDITQYDNMIYVWSELDVHKRIFAQQNNIRYFEIYKQPQVRYIKVQFELLINSIKERNAYNISGDALRKEFEFFKEAHTNKLAESVGHQNCIIKQFQCAEFFKREMEIYATQPNTRRKLIQNRCEYLNKKEWQLTTDDLLTGFKKSGIYYGYSHFNPLWTNWFITRYNIKTVYDPCGGWGHHMLGMLSCDKIIYNDDSCKVSANIQEMKTYFSIDNLEVHCDDAQIYIPESVDAFFMCPPYFNVEDYGNEFKSLEEYEKFLKRIFKIWNNNSASVFGLIIREDFVSLIDDKPVESFALNYGKSHFSKINDKKNSEYFYIFKK